MSTGALTLPRLIGDTLAILRRHGALIFAEVLALAMAIDLLAALLAPERTVASALGLRTTSLLGAYGDPFVLLHEALFAIVFAGACLRIAAAPGTRPAAVARADLPALIGLNIAASLATYIGILMLVVPGILLSAGLTLMVPVLVLERKGWSSPLIAWTRARPALGTLASGWAMILIPWLLFALSRAPLPAEWASLPAPEAAGNIIVATLPITVLSSVFGTAAICLSMAAWQALSESDAARISRIFR